MSTIKKIRVLVVDDSAVVRHVISEALNQDPEIEVVGTACDPYIARDKIVELNPDVLTLDIEMPRMDGLTFLKILQERRPLPVVVISSLTHKGSQAALTALELGAVEVLAKPNSSWSIGELRDHLAKHVKAAARARIVRRPGTTASQVARPPHGVTGPVRFHARQLMLVGASTGGTEAIKSMFCQLPDGLPGICVVQHIPPIFSKAFADRLNEHCAFEVREAVDGDLVRPGLALIAPGDYHMQVQWIGTGYQVRLSQTPPIHHVRPAVDLLFDSAADCAGPHAVAVILTGMGSDGAKGMLKLKAAGAETIAQDEQTCMVYGMPRAAAELGAVNQVLPLDKIARSVVTRLEINARRLSAPNTAAASAADASRR